MANQQIQTVMEQSVLHAAKVIEDQLDTEMMKLENMEEDDLEKLRYTSCMLINIIAKYNLYFNSYLVHL